MQNINNKIDGIDQDPLQKWFDENNKNATITDNRMLEILDKNVEDKMITEEEKAACSK